MIPSTGENDDIRIKQAMEVIGNLPYQDPAGGERETYYSNWHIYDDKSEIPANDGYVKETGATWVYTGTDISGSMNVYANISGTINFSGWHTGFGTGNTVVVIDKGGNQDFYLKSKKS